MRSAVMRPAPVTGGARAVVGRPAGKVGARGDTGCGGHTLLSGVVHLPEAVLATGQRVGKLTGASSFQPVLVSAKRSSPWGVGDCRGERWCSADAAPWCSHALVWGEESIAA